VNLELEGRVAIVTGASRGLGRAMVEALASEGTKVMAVARSGDELAELESETVRTRVCDVRNRDDLAALPAHALDAFGRLDIVVNNAGIAPAGAFIDQAEAEWDEVFAVNVTGPAILTRAAGPHLLQNAHGGRVINVASTTGITGKPQLVSYSASKAALIQFTRALAAEWAPAGVQVNAVAPGAFETDAQRVVLESPELLARRIRKIPAGRLALPAEIGPLVCMLASPLLSFVTGSVFVIDGGEVSKL
jgi:2-deoxy-D-gluconate 3-dehydrogenase